VFSPGWGNEATFYLFVGTRLASHGFVVAILTHQGDGLSPVPTADPIDHIAMVMLNRPRDVSFALTRLLEENDRRGSPLRGLIEPTRIAASGHSMGGYAALVLGGAGDDAVCDSVAMDSEWMGPPPPEACGSSAPDPRIGAVLYLDASNQLLRFSELARIHLPIQGAGQDPDSLNATPPPWGSWQARIHAAVRSEHAYRADVKHAIHLSFTNFCQVFPVYLHNGVIDQATFDSGMQFVCGDTSPIIGGAPLLPQLEAQRLAMKVAIPFLKSFLAGDARYKHMISARWVNGRETNVAFFETEEGGTTHEGPGAPYLDPSWTDEFDYYLYPPAKGD
jgi:predicted dienelactone hydrolase